MSFTDKIAIVTGASRGIGKAIALELARQGANVIGTATSSQGAEIISNYIKEANLTGQGYVLNVADPDSIEQFMSAVQSDWGNPAILVNNAAITRDNLMLRMKQDEWDDVITTNLNSVFRMSKACLRGMMKARWGRIINITSIVGVTGNPGQANYAATKSALLGFGKSLAQEVASRNITVNAIAPGFIDTDMTRALSEEQREQLLVKIPANRLGEAQDIAATAGFLASEAADYITGQTIHVNGGMYMS